MPETISESEALLDLLGTICRGCNGTKPTRMSHCRPCYMLLPQPMRSALYKRIGEGYEQAYTESLAYIRERRGARAK